MTLLERKATEDGTTVDMPLSENHDKSGPKPGPRLAYFDWLKIILILLVFTGHVVSFYFPFLDEIWPTTSPVIDPTMTGGITIYFFLLLAFVMPTFFVISGFGAYKSIITKKPWDYIKDRIKRLLIPFLFGIFVVIPPVVYYDRVFHGQFVGSYLEFYPHYFEGFYHFGNGNFSFIGELLYYLLFLFVMSIVAIPIFTFIKKKKDNSKLFARAVEFFKKPGRIFSLILIIGATECLSCMVVYIMGFGGWQIASYIAFFSIGGFFAMVPDYHEMLEKNVKPALIIGIVADIMRQLMVPQIVQNIQEWGVLTHLRLDETFLFLMGYEALFVIEAVCWLIVIMHLAQKLPNRPSAKLKVYTELAMPFYILHETVLTIISFYVFQLGLNAYLACFVFGIISFPTVLALAFVIRKINPLRFFFGLGRLKKAKE